MARCQRRLGSACQILAEPFMDELLRPRSALLVKIGLSEILEEVNVF